MTDTGIPMLALVSGTCCPSMMFSFAANFWSGLAGQVCGNNKYIHPLNNLSPL
jgi:hypothetical protein